MSSETPPAPAASAPITVNGALAQAARLLRNAEMISDHALMLRTESLADSWASLARIALERDRGGPL
ncbi:hypothetical protein ABTZ78_17390 [Streptomyces bauhiniae]|uniref:hypothetical protein n=1 Tax=Streptomyces bauhiniae TaxID=2340725 RepID=UPI00331F2E60